MILFVVLHKLSILIFRKLVCTSGIVLQLLVMPLKLISDALLQFIMKCEPDANRPIKSK